MRQSPRAQADAQLLAQTTANAAKALGLTQEELGRVIGRDRTSLHRGIDPSSKAGELSLLLVRIYRALYQLNQGEAAMMRRWFGSANRATGGIPRQQVASPLELGRIVDYLESHCGQL